MTAIQKMDAAVSFSFHQVDYLETWLRSVDNMLSGVGDDREKREALNAERRSIIADMKHREGQFRELIEERSMLRREKHRARRQIRVA